MPLPTCALTHCQRSRASTAPWPTASECDGCPGAFGARDTIADVDTFRVIVDQWHEDRDGNVWRTILSAEVEDFAPRSRPFRAVAEVVGGIAPGLCTLVGEVEEAAELIARWIAG